MIRPTPGEVAAALSARTHARIESGGRRAAVALVLRDSPGGSLELLFMLRAQHEHDPWSGHVSFPGGRAEPQDPGPEATAIRETLEETGLDLTRDAERLGALDEVRALARARPIDLVISPFVFHLRRPQEGTPGSEVVSLHWLSFERLLAPEARSVVEYQPSPGVLRTLPSLNLDGIVIWGLTHHMLRDLVTLLGGFLEATPRPRESEV